jgi:predicted DNA-binding protein (UPF0251 family)
LKGNKFGKFKKILYTSIKYQFEIDFMGRPKSPRKVNFQPTVYYFKPRGVPLRQLEEVEIFPDELQAVKLYKIDRLNQTEAAEKMGVSQATLARILDSAETKMAQALVYGKALKINEK